MKIELVDKMNILNEACFDILYVVLYLTDVVLQKVKVCFVL